MSVLDPEKKEVYKFLQCEQGDKIDVKMVMKRVKEEIRKGNKTIGEPKFSCHKHKSHAGSRIHNERVSSGERKSRRIGQDHEGRIKTSMQSLGIRQR